MNDPGNDPNRNHINRGPTIPGDPSYIGEEAINTAYTNVSVPQNWTVYSPTMRPPGDPSCVEVTTIYGPNNYAALGIWNWCPDGIHQNFYDTKTIDSTFVNTYVSQNSNGNPSYDVQSHVNSDGTWHVFIYNWPQNAYEELNAYNSDGTPYYPSNTAYTGGPQTGWNFFEFYATTYAPCATFPTMEAERMQVLEANGTTNTWTPVSSATVSESTPSECFNDTSGTSPFFQYSYGSAANGYFWQVASF